MELEDYFKTPSQEEVDRQWLTQLCYDGQMADDEIEEHVDAVIEWNEKRVKNNVDLYIVRLSLLDKVKEIAFGDGSAQERMVDIKVLFSNEA